MRISKADVAIREQFVKEFFRKFGTDTTVAEANNEVKVKFGKMMRAVRMYELRAEIEAESKVEVAPVVAEVAVPAEAPKAEAPVASEPIPAASEPIPAARTSINDADAELAALLSELTETE